MILYRRSACFEFLHVWRGSEKHRSCPNSIPCERWYTCFHLDSQGGRLYVETVFWKSSLLVS